MRFLTCVIVAVTVLVGAFFGYCFYGAQVQLESVGTVKTPANEMLDSFSAVREQLSLDAFYGEQSARRSLRRRRTMRSSH